MSNKKQIEEAVKIVEEAFLEDYNLGCDPCAGTVVEHLYNARWRKKADIIDEFVDRLKRAPIKCPLPLLGLSTKQEVEDYFDGILLDVGRAIKNVADEMKGGAE